ncbi:MAG: hypothetical protein N2385_06010 [Chloroflexus sp.]|nr:hypothetical protein [Chloroflexus sp.]
MRRDTYRGAWRQRLAIYLTLLPAMVVAELLVRAEIDPLSGQGIAILAPTVIGLALLGGWIGSRP